MSYCFARVRPTFVSLLLLLCASLAMAQQQMPLVKSIEIQYAGAATISREKILANMRTRVGRPYDDKVVEDDVRSLYATGNVSNVRIFGEPAGEGVKVIVVVQAKAQISEVLINGPQKVKTTRIRKEITAQPGQPLNEANLEADRQKIIEYYAGKGFGEADVRYVVEPNEQAGTAKVIFSITEGGKIKIRAVRFEGVTNVKVSEIKKVIKTKPKGILDLFSKAGRLNSETLDDDSKAIVELYQSKGYVDVRVGTPRVDRQGDKVDIIFPVTEGLPYTVGKVSYTGAQAFTVEELTRGAKLKTGAVYSPQAVRDDLRTIQNTYGSKGYVDLVAYPETSPAAAQVVDITFRIEEGVQSYVEKINISGNTKTKDKVIRREVAVAPGDVYNTVRVDASRNRLNNLNYFSRVDTFPQETGVPGRKDLAVRVEEKRTGNLNFGAGFSSIDNLLGFVEVTQGNFDLMNYPSFTGAGQKFRLRLQYGLRRKDFVLALTEPYFLDQKMAVGGELFFRDAAFVSDVYDEQRYGIDLNMRKPINEFSFYRLGYRFESVDIHDLDEGVSESIRQEEGESLKSQIYAGYTFDSRDDVFLTRKGWRVEAGAFFAGAFLGGDVDIYGFNVEATRYISLPWDTILILNGEVGIVDAHGDSGGRTNPVPIFDRLYLGGANNLRGFRFREASPVDSNGEPIGGNTLIRATIEYTFPVVEKVRGALFYDVGMVSIDSYDLGGDIYGNVGIGVRVDVPGLGPIRIDYGIPIQSGDSDEDGGQFQFNVGYQF